METGYHLESHLDSFLLCLLRIFKGQKVGDYKKHQKLGPGTVPACSTQPGQEQRGGCP